MSTALVDTLVLAAGIFGAIVLLIITGKSIRGGAWDVGAFLEAAVSVVAVAYALVRFGVIR